jgi:hypothetical protein
MYSSEALWREFERLHEKLFPEIPADLPPEPIRWESQPQLAVSPTAELPKYQELQKNIEIEIIGLLRTGGLLGVGFLKPKFRGAEPRWIPANDWNDDCKISWENSGLYSKDKDYADVHVVRPKVPISISAASDMLAIQLAPSPGRNRSGRPSLASEIKAAYEELKSEDKIDFGSIGANVAAIKSRVCSRFGLDPASTKSLKYDAVRKVITADFRKDKIEYKSSKLPS